MPLNAWDFWPSYAAPRKNMTRRGRQTTKGNTAKNRTGAARTATHCLWIIREKGQTPTVPTRRKPCWPFGPAMSPSGNTRPRQFGPVMSSSGSTRPRDHDASPHPRFLASCPLRSLAKVWEKPPYLRPKRQRALSFFCFTRDAILP